MLLAVAVGETAADVVNSSGPAQLMAARSYVAAAVPVIDDSTALAGWITEARVKPLTLGRQGLLEALGHLESGCAQVRADFHSIAIAPPTTRAGELLGGVFLERWRAAGSFTAAVVDALSSSGRIGALAKLQEAAGDIRTSDYDYVAFQRALPARAKEHTVALPVSDWASATSWGGPSLADYVTTLSSDPALAIHHDLTILAVTLTPPVLRITPTTTTTTTTSTTTTTTSTTTTTTLPGQSTGSTTTTSTSTTTTSTSTTTTTLQVPPADSTSYLAPTRRLQVVVVVANSGDVAESGVVVAAVLAPVPETATSGHLKSGSSRRRAVPPPRTERVTHPIRSFGAESSEVLHLPRFDVERGVEYLLTVSISAPGTAPGMHDTETVRLFVAG